MTAEIAIITRQAVVLAADSAVTVGKDRVWKTANKLFSLGPKHDIAIMIYGSGDFLSLPWEVVIKEYRARAASNPFNTVRDCAEDFKTFLLSSVFERDDRQRNSVLFPMFDFLSAIAKSTADKDGNHDVQAVRDKIAETRLVVIDKGQLAPDIDEDEVASSFMDAVTKFAAAYLGEDEAAALEDDIKGLLFDFLRSKFESEYSSGVVIAGFGEEEYFPSLLHFAVDGRWGGRLRWWESDSKDLNAPDADEDFPIIPFAQQDMPFLFMAGISPGYISFLDDSLAGLIEGAGKEVIDAFVDSADQEAASELTADLSEKLANAFMKKLYDKVRKEQYAPINRAVTALPKEEMALMAEALVDITSLKRKVDSVIESVGGPVDVAVISKGDGFIWYKRKHYFDPSLNHDFFQRKRARNGDGT